jgi:hypothetical protein
MAVAHPPGVPGRHQATTVQDIQEFSFKGYDQQPPGFSKPGFFLFWGTSLPTFCRGLPMFFNLFTGSGPL